MPLRAEKVSAPAQLPGRDIPQARPSCANAEIRPHFEFRQAPGYNRPIAPRRTRPEPAHPFPPPRQTKSQALPPNRLRPKSSSVAQRSAEILPSLRIFGRRSLRSSDFSSPRQFRRIALFSAFRRLPKLFHLLARYIRQRRSALRRQIFHPPESRRKLRVGFLQRNLWINMQKTRQIHGRK